MALILFLFASFVIQPVHLAYANEAALAAAEPEEPEAVTAEAVAEHQAVEPEPEEVVEVVETESVEVAAEEEELLPAQSEAEVTQSLEELTAGATEELALPAVEELVEEADEEPVTAAASTTNSDSGLTESNPETVIGTSTVEIEPVATGSTSSSAVLQVPPLATTTDSSLELAADSLSASTSASTTVAEVAVTTSSSSTSTSTSANSAVVTQHSDQSSPADNLPETELGPVTDSNDELAEEKAEPKASVDPVDEVEDTQGVVGSEEVELEFETSPATATTELSREVVNNIEYLVTEENYYQFSKQSCVSVGDGAFHCSENDGEIIDSQAIVYSEVGANKNSEIFIKTARGKVEQITDNDYEDTAPHYDPESLRIVWQRLIDGRYQIIVYDIKTKEETQLTFSRTNSMEPAVSVAGVVWQAWDNNDWEIMFFDGTYTDQLTDNSTQDLAPVIEDEYVIWTVIGGKAQYAQVYSLVSQEIVTINNHEGGSIVNPRFVLVYDTQFDNGDVVTQRFDPETGFSAPIAAKAAPEPIDIPDSDSTGETRALIQNKSSSKETGEVTVKEPASGSGGEPAVDTNDELDISQASAADLELTATTSPAVTNDNATSSQSYIELTEYDLIITPEEAAAARAEAEVTDLTIATGTSKTATSTQLLRR